MYLSVLSLSLSPHPPTGRQIEFPSYELKNNQMLGLLVPGKQGAIEISKMMYNTPGVNFALVSSAMYKGHFLSVVCIRVDSSKIRDLWVWLFEEEKEMLLRKGLLAIVMQSGTFVWLRGRPSSGKKTVFSLLLLLWRM